MRIGIISDVHSNLPALEVVLAELKREKPDIVIFLGDAVGYGAHPNECCEIVKEICSFHLIGNHDAGVVGKIDLGWFNHIAAEAIVWTRDRISEDNKRFLESMVYTHSIDGFLFSHGSPVSPQDFIYVFDRYEAMKVLNWARDKYRAVFVGHAHITLSFFKKIGEAAVVPFIEDEVELGDDCAYLINVGSVGQPRDGDPRGAYAILDTEKMLYRVIRVEYQVEKAAKFIWDAGLPHSLGERLLSGV